jgi:hypothetical protein
MDAMTTRTDATPRTARARLAKTLRRLDDYTRHAFNAHPGHRRRG